MVLIVDHRVSLITSDLPANIKNRRNHRKEGLSRSIDITPRLNSMIGKPGNNRLPSVRGSIGRSCN